jgi:carbonic anhydrase
LTGFTAATLEPLKFSYKAGGDSIVNNGHAVQVSYAEGSSISVDGIQFVLKQFHFHAPSEHRLNGKSYPIEAHLVHEDGNSILATLWRSMPDTEGKPHALPAPFDVARLLPGTREYYRYNGSLTTPPCTEGVRWLVLKTPVSASKQQAATLSKVLRHPNNRPVQPVNARPVLR